MILMNFVSLCFYSMVLFYVHTLKSLLKSLAYREMLRMLCLWLVSVREVSISLINETKSFEYRNDFV